MHLQVRPDPIDPARGPLSVWSDPAQALVLERATEEEVVAYFRKAGADRAESLARRLIALARRHRPAPRTDAKVAPLPAPAPKRARR